MSDQRPTVIHTGGSGAAGWAVAVILLVVIGAGVLFFSGNLSLDGGGTKNVDVNVTLPEVETPATAPVQAE